MSSTLPQVAGPKGPRAGAGPAGQRQQFLSGLLNEDLQKLAQWHQSRPHHEQKNFLRSVDTLYKVFSGAPPSQGKRQAAPNRDAAQRAAAAAANDAALRAEQDPVEGMPSTPRGLATSASDPGLAPARPIEVFEQRKRRGLRHKRGPGEDDPNSFDQWLEGASVSSMTTATTSTASRVTSFTNLTATSSGSSQGSGPVTTNQAHYRMHRRAHALNKSLQRNVDQHNAGCLKEGIPGAGWPDCERLQTSFKDAFGARPLAENISKGMYSNVFKEEKHPFVEDFLDGASDAQREQFSNMVRSLQYLRTAQKKETTSRMRQELDLEENKRLFVPVRHIPKVGINGQSQVPLGSQNLKKPADGPTPPPPQVLAPPAPPSPTVSGLGSLPLSRLSTPMMP